MKRGSAGRIYSVLFAFLSFASCQGEADNTLSGSITDNYDMAFDDVRVRLYSSALSIEYVKKKGDYEQIPVRVTLSMDEADLEAGKKYDLVEQGSISRGRGYGSALPEELESGYVELFEFGYGDGAIVEGKFGAVFITPNGSKQTLHGNFSCELDVFDAGADVNTEEER